MKYTIEHIKLQVFAAVNAERNRQDKLWGIQRHEMGKWLAILGEEYGEVCQASQKVMGLASVKDSDADDLYKELIQVAAVSVAIAEQLREENLKTKGEFKNV